MDLRRRRAPRRSGKLAASLIASQSAPSAHTGSSSMARRIWPDRFNSPPGLATGPESGSGPPVREISPVPAAGAKIPPWRNKAHRPPAGWRSRGRGAPLRCPPASDAMPMPRPRSALSTARGPSSRASCAADPDRPEAHRAAQHAIFHRDKRQIRHRRHAFAQPVGGFGETAGTEAGLVQRLDPRRVGGGFGRATASSG